MPSDMLLSWAAAPALHAAAEATQTVAATATATAIASAPSATLEPAATPAATAGNSVAFQQTGQLQPDIGKPEIIPVSVDGQEIIVLAPDGATPVPTVSAQTATPVEPLPPAPAPATVLPWLLMALAVLAVALAAVFWRRQQSAHPRKGRKGEMDEELAVTEPIRSEPALRVGTAQHIGTREEQEDALCCSDYRNAETLATRGVFAAVADGVGGMSDGQLASTTAARGLLSLFTQQDTEENPAQRILTLVTSAHREILDLNLTRDQPCGSTLVCALIKGNMLYFASVGDSGILLYRAGGLLQLNREHVLGAEMDVQVALGQRPAEEVSVRRRKAITAYLGKEGLKLIDRNVRPIKLMPGDRVLLMSDGVFGTLSEDEIIQAQQADPVSAAKDIVRRVESHRRTHQDNATVVILGYDGGMNS